MSEKLLDVVKAYQDEHVRDITKGSLLVAVIWAVFGIPCLIMGFSESDTGNVAVGSFLVTGAVFLLLLVGLVRSLNESCKASLEITHANFEIDRILREENTRVQEDESWGGE